MIAPALPRVVMASGVWSLLHRGHLNLLARARQLADGAGVPGVLVVGVVSDTGTAAYKGRAPVDNYAQRMQAIQRLGFVDVVELQHSTDPTPLLDRFRPDFFVHGDDWDRLREGHATLERLGIQYVAFPYTPGISTTLLREVV